MTTPTDLASDTRAEVLHTPRDQVAMHVALPGEPGYERCIPWNVAAPVTPAAVVLATSLQDVAGIVRFAAAQGFTGTVQANGHGAVGVGRTRYSCRPRREALRGGRSAPHRAGGSGRAVAGRARRRYAAGADAAMLATGQVMRTCPPLPPPLPPLPPCPLAPLPPCPASARVCTPTLRQCI
jgi:hypothetical protein